MPKRQPRGIIQRVRTPRATYTEQHLANGRTVFRKGGRFVSKRSYVAARAHKLARVEHSALSRAQGKGEPRRPSTQWVVEDGETDFGRAGPFAQTLLPELEIDERLTREQRSELFADMRLLHGFETYWHFRFPDLPRSEAEARFMELITKLRQLQNKIDRDDVREEFGLDRYETV